MYYATYPPRLEFVLAEIHYGACLLHCRQSNTTVSQCYLLFCAWMVVEFI